MKIAVGLMQSMFVICCISSVVQASDLNVQSFDDNVDVQYVPMLTKSDSAPTSGMQTIEQTENVTVEARRMGRFYEDWSRQRGSSTPYKRRIISESRAGHGKQIQFTDQRENPANDDPARLCIYYDKAKSILSSAAFSRSNCRLLWVVVDLAMLAA